MMLLVSIYTLFGLVIGSFVNVLVTRAATEESIGGRSRCFSCGHQLHSFDLIPVVSWLLLRGRCRYCQKPISLQYPLVEIATALLFLVVALADLTFVSAFLVLTIFSLYVAMFVFDLYYTLIPDLWSYAAAGVALIHAALFSEELLFGLLAGPAIALPLFSLWAFSKGRWMGLGDAKLALSIGWLLGPALGIISLFLAFVIGAIVSIFLLLLTSYAQKWCMFGLRWLPRELTMKSEVPFGPFLIASCVIVWSLNAFGIPLTLL